MYVIEITDTAASELHEIYDYISIELEAKPSAEKLIRKIEKKIATLSALPSFRKYTFNSDYYITHIGKYNIIYKVDEKTKVVFIAHIVYSRRKPQRY